ncbi:DegT/DnrJ/EryC1/StrS family aminotransferase [archaeon]
MIPLVRPYFDEAEAKAVEETLKSGWVAGQGPRCRELEEKFSAYNGSKFAITVNNCTAALHLSLLAHGVKKGDEVIVADYTYPATGHAVMYCGATPVFTDVDARTYNINPEEIKKNITEKTVGIIPVHTFGQPADMDPIMEIAREKGLFVVEDAACAAGAEYKGKKAGSMGDVGCFSMHARKNMSTGEGGLITTDNEKLMGKMRSLSCFGIESAHKRASGGFSVPMFTELGYNYKLSDIAASIGIWQLAKLDTIITRRRELVKTYLAGLEGIKGITPPFESQDGKHIYQSFVCLVDKEVNRNEVITKLRENGVEAQIGTYSCHIQPVYNSSYKCPVSEDVFNRAIALPMYYGLKDSEVDYVIEKVGTVLE